MAGGNGKRSSALGQPATTIAELQQNADLWYRIHVLLHDLANVGKDPRSTSRLSTTTDELYISLPYFTSSEASTILGTHLRFEAVVESDSSSIDSEDDMTGHDSLSVEAAIKQRMKNFFDKRKASGDARPCGPHDLVPIYTTVFDIQQSELKDEKLLSRLRRSGLGDLKTKGINKTNIAQKSTNGKGKKGKKGKKGQ